MLRTKDRAEVAETLRRQAEELAVGNAAPLAAKPEKLSLAESRRLLHELRVHQIELEMQNQQLREAEVQLKVEEARYFDLYELAPVGYCSLSGKGLVKEANLTLSTLLGMPRNKLVSQRFTRFIFKQDQDIFYHHTRRLFETANPQVGELRMVKADGGLLWARLESTLAWDEKGAPVCRLIVSDITERVRAQEERDQVLLEFYQLQKEDSIGRLAGGVAHDFNNMLSVILGYTELAMSRTSPGSPILGDLQEVFNAANRSADLTRQLLAYARKQTSTPKVLNLNQTLEGMLAMLRRLIGENLELEWRPCADPWPVRMDPFQVDQILTNLCLNARDAIEGVGKVIIETDRAVYDQAYCAQHPDHQTGEFMRVAVKDNGAGMEPGTLQNLFEPFYTTKEIGRGTGLGLATVQGIVKQNHGFITVRSTPAQGTTLEVNLPRHEGGWGQEVWPDQPLPGERGRETVLLVEDEVAIVRLCQAMLEELGYHVLGATNPTEALELADRHAGEIDLLLTDVLMPEMNGREMSLQVRDRHPRIKCLFMSGYTADIIACQGVLVEGVDFIQKPFSKAQLAATLRRVMQA